MPVSTDEWHAALETLARADDPAGETSRTLAARWGVCVAVARQKVRDLVAAGMAECVGVKKASNGREKVYRLVKR
jgi:hypothetical protein